MFFCWYNIFTANSLVKLNNPQMGTETNIHIHNQTNGGIILVKLNNPQMGTETVLYSFRFQLIAVIQLN